MAGDRTRTLGRAALAGALALLAAAGSASATTVSIPPTEPCTGAAPAPIDPAPYDAVLGDPPGCASVIVDTEQATIRREPDARSKRRGVAMRGARLPALGRKSGPGCADAWYRVHDRGWICGMSVTTSLEPAAAPRYPVVPEGEVTPWPYAFVRDSAIEYRFAGGALEEVRELLKGFGFGVAGTTSFDGRAFLKTAEGNLVPRGTAGITSRLSELSGVEIVDGRPWPVGWVNAKTAWAYDAPSREKRHRVAQADRYAVIEVLETAGEGKRGFVRFDDGAWFSAADVRIARPATRPAIVGAREKWIDVDLERQVITAYAGDAPVYATLVSTGRGGKSKTVKGDYRIWAKVAAIAMDNTEEAIEANEALELADAGVPLEEVNLYSLRDVPWTQFFFESFALHGVYWHDRFGNRRSHGCVNLSPIDARWFYEWTEPRVPDGWWAIHPVEKTEGTLVHVR
ncbi:MAG: L,D-transpeptidase [Proteobacteria bacterium]|nr:L,D-transpeptidase [Pseudomonadota bacterium]